VLRGALLVLVSAACVAVDTILARVVTREVSPFVLVFFRNLFGLLAVAPWLAAGGGWVAFARGGRSSTSPARRSRSWASRASSTASPSCRWRRPRPIAFATPLFAAAGAAAFLGETLRHGRLAAILLGFAGVLIVLRPRRRGAASRRARVLASAVALAAIGLLAKVLARHDPPRTIVAINLSCPVPLALLAAIPSGPPPPSRRWA
jgi:drug/metabolite transporter (DMT)-like permease